MRLNNVKKKHNKHVHTNNICCRPTINHSIIGSFLFVEGINIARHFLVLAHFSQVHNKNVVKGEAHYLKKTKKHII